LRACTARRPAAARPVQIADLLAKIVWHIERK
jgi:hypothetical protein